MRCSPADSAALLVVFLPDRVLALARHLQNTVSNIDWLHSRGPFPAQLRNCSWPIQGHSLREAESTALLAKALQAAFHKGHAQL